MSRNQVILLGNVLFYVVPIVLYVLALMVLTVWDLPENTVPCITFFTHDLPCNTRGNDCSSVTDNWQGRAD